MNAQLSIRRDGVVYTPKKLAEYVAKKTLQYVLDDDYFVARNQISIIDPACGDGELLENISNLLTKNHKNKTIFCGIDINQNAISSCKEKFSLDGRDSFRFVRTNALCPFNQKIFDAGWKKLYEKMKLGEKFDILIANPPWGQTFLPYKERIDAQEFVTLKKQSDSFEIFLELAPKIVKPNGYFAFIIPDSILNQSKRIMREKLVSSTEIKYIGRLGEKIFSGINRACVVIICKNCKPKKNSKIDCFRLLSNERKIILNYDNSFENAETGNIHKVLQSRFSENTNKQFDIDLKDNEQYVLEKLFRNTKTVGDYLFSKRGVELGISGEICLCSKCKSWMPMPKKQLVVCNHCNNKILLQESKKMSVVTKNKIKNSTLLITGKDLKRYVCVPGQRIILGKKGINYKTKNTYQPPKILVRKTGVGITAAIDYTHSYTTQVVYILKTKKHVETELEFFISLLNSRVYYFILAKLYGELEWRSHPYLTQSQIEDLPLPDLEDKTNSQIIDEIIALMKSSKTADRLTDDIDLEIELLIGRLFKLTKSDYKIIFDSIDQADELLPVKHLKNIELADVLKKIR